MRPGGGKAKGSGYERVVAKILGEAYYPDHEGRFERIYSHPIPAKGEVRGDLIALRYCIVGPNDEKALVKDSSWPFCVECKNYKDIKPFFIGLYASDTALFDWMQQASVVAEKDKKIPLVIFRLFRTPDIAMLRLTDFERLKEMFGFCKYRHFELKTRGHTKVVADRGIYSIGEFSICCLLLSDILDWIDFGVYKLASKGRYIRSLLPKGQEEEL